MAIIITFEGIAPELPVKSAPDIFAILPDSVWVPGEENPAYVWPLAKRLLWAQPLNRWVYEFFPEVIL